MTRSIRVEPVVALPLGEDAAELTDLLWPGRCQTCGEALQPDGGASRSGAANGSAGAPDEIVVAVDEGASFAVASLHHRRCRSPEWRVTGDGPDPARPDYVTTSASLVMLPLTLPGTSGLTPTILVNPSLERLSLNPGSRPPWRISLSRYQAAGLRAPGRDPVPSTPVPNCWWDLDGDQLTLQVETTYPETFQLQVLDPRDLDDLAERPPLLLAVTHAIDPERFTDLDDLAVAMITGRVLCGWIASA